MLSFFSAAGQRLVATVDRFNDRFTSYRLVLYFLLTLLGWALVASLANQVPYHWYSILISAAWISAVCYVVNKILSKFLNIPANNESYLISALILAFIMTPAASGSDYAALAVAAAAAMASKYLLVLRRSHIFNPAAFGAFIAGALMHDYASWWIGTKFTLPIIAIGSILILRKIKRFSLALVFCAVYVLFIIWQLPNGSSTDAIQHLVWLSIVATSLGFFSVIMLSEPLTSPASLNPTLIYAIVVGVLYSSNRLHFSPEEALLAGNILTFLIAPNRRFKLAFARRVQDAEGIASYVFRTPPGFKYQAGQYMEWTLKQTKTDSRGNRRYLTISSSPTEDEVMFTVKLPPQPSTFKQKLESLKPGDSILASYLAGNFTLPEDASQKLALVAGGVGITPFRSMVKYLIDKQERRDVAVLYGANKNSEFAFRELFSRASSVGLKSFYTTSVVTKEAIARALPDYLERTFYISGPQAFVESIHLDLTGLGVPQSQIKTDFFPGYGS